MKKYPLKSILHQRLRLPIVIENDVNAGLFGEQQFGAARGYQEVVGIFLGTGVGGALILNGEIYRGATGASGEIGHTFLSLPSLLHGKYQGETVETLIGRIRIASEAGNMVMKQKAPHLYDQVGFDIKKIKSGVLARAIRAGDSTIKTLMLDKARLLGITMANVVNLLNPELIVLGGGIIEAMGPIMIPEASRTMFQYAMGPVVKNVKVVPAKLKDYSIAMGAAKLALNSLAKGAHSKRKNR